MGSTKILSLPFINSRTKHPISWIQKYTPMGTQFFGKAPTLDSTLTWILLLSGNGKRPGSDHLLVEQRKYVQKKIFQKNSNR